MAETLDLVFDLDGTLIDSAPDIHATTNFVFQANGLQPFPYDIVRGFIGNGVGVLISRLMAHQGVPADADLHRKLMDDFEKIYVEAFDLTQLYPNVRECLDALAGAGHRLAICTNKPERPTRAVLRHFRLDGLFPVVIGGDSLSVRKPDPLPLLTAARELGGGTAVLVGDSEVDAATARAAGLPFALFLGGYRKAEPETLEPRLIFDDHGALPGLIAHLLPRL